MTPDEICEKLGRLITRDPLRYGWLKSYLQEEMRKAMPDYTPDETINGTFVTNSPRPERSIYRFVVQNGVIVEADWAAENALETARAIGGRSWWLPGKYLGWHVTWSVHSPSHHCAVARFREGVTGGEVDILEGMEYLYPAESEA